MGIGGMLEDFWQGVFQDIANLEFLHAGVELFLNPAVFVLCVVGGLKIGWSFLRRSFH